MPVSIEQAIGVEEAGDPRQGFAWQQFQEWCQILGANMFRRE